jgi:hypothetical protein
MPSPASTANKKLIVNIKRAAVLIELKNGTCINRNPYKGSCVPSAMREKISADEAKKTESPFFLPKTIPKRTGTIRES